MAIINYHRAEMYRRELGYKRKKSIQKMYNDLADETQKEIDKLTALSSPTVSQRAKLHYLNDLAVSTGIGLEKINKRLYMDVRSDIKNVSKAVCSNSESIFYGLGIDLKGSLHGVPDNIVENIVSGNLYGQKFKLSKAIWSDNRKQQQEIRMIISKGIASGKSTYEVAKDLERYVRPGARKPWDWSKVYPGVRKEIDYNAQRLARTEITHAYQQAVAQTVKANPEMFDGVEWICSNSHRTCELCQQRDGQIYSADRVPLDHPNGMCTNAPHLRYDPNSPLSQAEQLADRIAATSAKNLTGDELYDWFKKNGVDPGISREDFLRQQAIHNDLTNTENSGIVRPAKIIDKPIVTHEKAFDELESLFGNVTQADVDTMRSSGVKGNILSHIIHQSDGYGGLPTVVTADKFSELATHSTVLYRGVNPSGNHSADDFVDEFRDGAMYCGKSSYGSGVYATPDIMVAKKYADDNGAVFEVILDGTVKRITYKEAMLICDELRRSNRPLGYLHDEIVRNAGIIAEAIGYDVVDLDGFNENHHQVILNRTKVIVKE